MNLIDLSAQLRADVIEMSHRAKAAHLASALSCVDILAALYGEVLKLEATQPTAPHRDRFILSKGHAAAALYAALAWKGIIAREDLKQYGKQGSLLEEHPSPKQLGVEAATGSLGHGLPIGNGMALSCRITEQHFRVFVLLSDGECNEGSVWEAALFGACQQLNNLTAIIDYNKWQATGRTQEVLQLDPLIDKWRAFGWDALEIDGHDHTMLEHELNKHHPTQPRVLVAHTIKGKGVSFMEDDNNWHYRVPTGEEVTTAKKELGVL